MMSGSMTTIGSFTGSSDRSVSPSRATRGPRVLGDLPAPSQSNVTSVHGYASTTLQARGAQPAFPPPPGITPASLSASGVHNRSVAQRASSPSPCRGPSPAPTRGQWTGHMATWGQPQCTGTPTSSPRIARFITPPRGRPLIGTVPAWGQGFPIQR